MHSTSPICGLQILAAPSLFGHSETLLSKLLDASQCQCKSDANQKAFLLRDDTCSHRHPNHIFCIPTSQHLGEHSNGKYHSNNLHAPSENEKDHDPRGSQQ